MATCDVQTETEEAAFGPIAAGRFSAPPGIVFRQPGKNCGRNGERRSVIVFCRGWR